MAERNEGPITALRSALNLVVTVREKIEGPLKGERPTLAEKPQTYLYADQEVLMELSRELNEELNRINRLLGY